MKPGSGLPRLVYTSRPDGDDYRSSLEFALGQGFNGIDWNLDFFRLPVSSTERNAFAEALLRARDRYGLGFAFHAPCADAELGHARASYARVAVSYLKMHVDLLAESGLVPSVLTVHVGSRGIPERELDWDSAGRNLTDLVNYGESAGVCVALENLKHSWTSNPAGLKELLAASGAKATVDIGHARGSAAFAAAPAEGPGSVAGWIGDVARSATVVAAHVYSIETADGRHVLEEDLAPIRPALNALAATGCSWWVLELKSRAEILDLKARLVEVLSP